MYIVNYKCMNIVTSTYFLMGVVDENIHYKTVVWGLLKTVTIVVSLLSPTECEHLGDLWPYDCSVFICLNEKSFARGLVIYPGAIVRP